MIQAAYAITSFMALATVIFVCFALTILYADYKRDTRNSDISLPELRIGLVRAIITYQASILVAPEMQQELLVGLIRR